MSSLPMIVRAFTAGYKSGHHDTVEGCYTDVHNCDRDTYFTEAVEEMIQQGDFGDPSSPPLLRAEAGGGDSRHRRGQGHWSMHQRRPDRVPRPAPGGEAVNDLECPYCDHPMDVCHDDGFGYAEDKAHEMECDECGKTFVFHTSIHYYFSPSKADCLNGSPHNFGDWGRRWKGDDGLHEYRACKDCDHVDTRITPNPAPEE